MKVHNLCYAWKGYSGYSYGYNLITNEYDIADVIAQTEDNCKVVLFGWTPKSFSVVEALRKAGIIVSYACDFDSQITEEIKANDEIILKDFRSFFKGFTEEQKRKYYFIVYAPAGEDFNRAEKIKFLQHCGINEFGIIVEGYTKDFKGNKKLKEAFFASINEIFASSSMINNWSTIENLKRASLEGAGYWDVVYLLMYRLYKKKRGLKYFEVGPGIGVLSLSLKKVMDIDVTWLTIPNEERLWAEWKNEATLAVIKKKYNINIVEGFIETDSVTGQYDIIVMAQVMEHLIYNPVNTMKKLKELLSDDGVIFICVPEEIKHYNVDSYKQMPYPEDLTSEERERRTMVNAFGHFHEYSYEEAMAVFEESGLECVAHIFTSPIHHFMLKKKS